MSKRRTVVIRTKRPTETAPLVEDKFATGDLGVDPPPRTEEEFIKYLYTRFPGYTDLTINNIVRYARTVYGPKK